MTDDLVSCTVAYAVLARCVLTNYSQRRMVG